MADEKQDLTMGPTAWAMASALCLDDHCGCSQDTAPCLKAQEMAVCAMKAISKAGVSEYQIDNLADGTYHACDGHCHEMCGSE